MLKRCLILLACAVYLIAAASQPKTFTFKKVGDLEIEADVHVPNCTFRHKRPTVLAIHGGAFTVGTKATAFSPDMLEEVLRRGWIMVSINYRLAPGALIYDMIDDLRDAYHWMRTKLAKKYPIDINNIIVFGGSAGGAFALMSGYLLNPLPKVIVAFYPGCANCTGLDVYNPNTPVDAALIAHANSFRQPVQEYPLTSVSDPRIQLFLHAGSKGKMGWMLTTEDPNESSETIRATLKKYSSVDNVHCDYPPTYLAHGLKDTSVNYTNSVDMARQLEKFNIPYKLDLIPGALHSFEKPIETQRLWAELVPGFDPNTVFPDPEWIWEEHMLPMFEFVEEHLKKHPKKN